MVAILLCLKVYVVTRSDGGITMVNINVIKVDFTCTTLGRGVYSRLLLVSVGGRHT